MKGKKLWFWAVIAAGVIAAGIIFLKNSREEMPVPAASLTNSNLLWMLDAGHGGEDGGAVSPSGAIESQINLEITQRLDSILGFYGTPALMLRTEDRSLHDPDAVTLREKKVSDLHNRAEIVQRYPNATLLSIHQNIFSQAQYCGTQVFYAPTQGSQALAQAIQSAVQARLQPENDREAKPIPETVYLMNHVSNRAVLVECGFLSNPGEERALQEPGYQTQLAAVLAMECLNHTVE